VTLSPVVSTKHVYSLVFPKWVKKTRDKVGVVWDNLCMKTTNVATPTQANYRILELIEQLVSVVSKGTALGLSDLASAMFSGYFIESGGAVTPALEAFLHQQIEDAEEREARTRRGAKALTYGSYNLKELMDKLQDLIKAEGIWKPTIIQGLRVIAVDFTGYKRLGVDKLNAKAYFSDANRAVKAVPIGMIASVGEANGQRVALLKNTTVADLKVNDEAARTKQLYKQVVKELEDDEIAAFDAGFRLVGAVEAEILRCLMRLAKNITFGATPGKIPERTSDKGPAPSQYKAEIVRPLERKHGDKTLPATEADEIHTFINEDGLEIVVHIWNKVYFLERQLKGVANERKRKKLRHTPIKVMAIYDPRYDDPLLVGTPLLELEPEAAPQIYAARWPVEGLPQTGKYILSGGTGTHYVHHPTAMERLPVLSLLFGSLLKYAAATLPPFRTGFWDRAAKPTYGRLLRHLKKVGLPLSEQLFKKESVTAHLPVGYEAIRLSRA